MCNSFYGTAGYISSMSNESVLFMCQPTSREQAAQYCCKHTVAWRNVNSRLYLQNRVHWFALQVMTGGWNHIETNVQRKHTGSWLKCYTLFCSCVSVVQETCKYFRLSKLRIIVDETLLFDGITGILFFVHRPALKKKQPFGNWICFSPQAKKRCVFKHRTMGKVAKPINPECYTPSSQRSQPFRISYCSCF
jgi:hypothetical protein